jgi:hypothetical protein
VSLLLQLLQALADGFQVKRRPEFLATYVKSLTWKGAWLPSRSE